MSMGIEDFYKNEVENDPTLQYAFVKELHRVLEGLYFLDGMNPRKSTILWEIIDRAVNIYIYICMYIICIFIPLFSKFRTTNY